MTTSQTAPPPLNTLAKIWREIKRPFRRLWCSARRKFDLARKIDLAKRLQAKNFANLITAPINVDLCFNKQHLTFFIPANAGVFENRLEKWLCTAIKPEKIYGDDANKSDIAKCDFLFAWVYNFFIEHIDIYNEFSNKPILFLEDGFLKSITNDFGDSEFSRGFGTCWFIDDLGFHFDSTKPSRLEVMLNDAKLVITDAQKQRAKRIMSMLAQNKLTKYNHQPIYTPIIGRNDKKKVLVVEQSYADAAISLSNADQSTFTKMLETAITENPDSDIIVKTHPDPIAGQRGGLSQAYYANIKQTDQIYPVNIAINPFSIMELVDKVYVCSSMFGLEALMVNKKVRVFGMPSYAGWGMTEDEQICHRRTHRRTIEEFVYIAYVLYARYVIEDHWCEVEDAIDYLIKKRDKYFLLFPKMAM